jgi:hypothetical protein
MKRIATTASLLGLSLLAHSSPAHACGPFLNRSLLGSGDAALCDAPPLDFDSLLAALAGRAGSAIPESNTGASESDAEIDLRSALLAEGRTTTEIERIVQAWSNYRQHIGVLDEPAFPTDLPAEFELYLRGARAWYRHQHASAESSFRAVLELPASDRRHRSVWAAFMLGRLALDRCEAADRWFGLSRELVADGFVDTIGLGPASWGEQAGCWLRSSHDPLEVPWTKVVDLYVQQYAAGDPWASDSLREVAERALDESIEHPELLDRLARDRQTRALIHAHLAAHPHLALEGHGERWLAAVEAAPSLPSPGAGSLAWIAYQAADMTAAERWLRVADPEDPLARWVEAKLLLRTGAPESMEQARETLRELERDLESSTDIGVHDWRVGLDPAGIGPSAAADEALLAMRTDRFVDALAATLRAHSWIDAAYVAEQVLTIDELREFVDALPDDVREYESDLRWLLARRLARADRWADALPYYPIELVREAERQHEDLQRADDLELDASVRANSLWRAGKRMRELGMELTGTEVEPDWHWYEGDFDPMGIGDQRRALQSDARLTAPTPDELARVNRHFDFDLPRFHYRWRAAELGQQAADLLPDDHEAGARVSCQAAHWIRSRDYRGADRLIRAMIRRNPNITIAHYGDHLLNDPVENACSLDGIDFAAPPVVRVVEPVEPFDWLDRLRGLIHREWPALIGLALLVLFGLMAMGGRRAPTGPGSRSL